MTDLDAIYQEAKAAKALLAELNESIERATKQRAELLASLSEAAKYLLNGAVKSVKPAAESKRKSGRRPAVPGDDSLTGAVLARIQADWAPYAPIARGGSTKRRNEYSTLSRLHARGRIERRVAPMGIGYEYRRKP